MKRMYTELAAKENKLVYVVSGDTYEIREALKEEGFEWIPWDMQWEKGLTGTKKEVVALTKELNKKLEAYGVVYFSAKASNIALHKAFAE